jgi:hypothetical protein
VEIHAAPLRVVLRLNRTKADRDRHHIPFPDQTAGLIRERIHSMGREFCGSPQGIIDDANLDRARDRGLRVVVTPQNDRIALVVGEAPARWVKVSLLSVDAAVGQLKGNVRAPALTARASVCLWMALVNVWSPCLVMASPLLHSPGHHTPVRAQLSFRAGCL